MKRALEVLMLGVCPGFFAFAAPRDASDKAGKMDGHKMKQKKANGKMQKNESDAGK